MSLHILISFRTYIFEIFFNLSSNFSFSFFTKFKLLLWLLSLFWQLAYWNWTRGNSLISLRRSLLSHILLNLSSNFSFSIFTNLKLLLLLLRRSLSLLLLHLLLLSLLHLLLLHLLLLSLLLLHLHLLLLSLLLLPLFIIPRFSLLL
jgi:hypothetical protein